MHTWTEADFDELSWHDCHVHAFALRETQHGHANLTLDIDFILEWQQPDERSFRFLVAPATLVFLDVFGLRMQLDYTGFAVAPFSLDGVERELEFDVDGVRQFTYRLAIDYPVTQGSITFSGNRFVQRLRAEPILTDRQGLDPAQRAPFTATD